MTTHTDEQATLTKHELQVEHEPTYQPPTLIVALSMLSLPISAFLTVHVGHLSMAAFCAVLTAINIYVVLCWIEWLAGRRDRVLR